MIDLARALWLDVEASGIAPDSYPVEVGWCDIEERTGWVQIRPEPTWTHWDPEAEALHGITRARLVAKGLPVGEAAARIAEATADRVVLSDNPTCDTAWLEKLFAAAGQMVPFQLEDAGMAVSALARHLRVRRIGLMGPADAAQQFAPITHRAADDARHWSVLTRLVTLEEREP